MPVFFSHILLNSIFEGPQEAVTVLEYFMVVGALPGIRNRVKIYLIENPPKKIQNKKHWKFYELVHMRGRFPLVF